MTILNFEIYRYNPEHAEHKPYMQSYALPLEHCNGTMLLDALLAIKELDPTLSFRSSCGEGVCGSDGMNINGVNRLACITRLQDLKAHKIVIRPLPGFKIIRDLVVDMTDFYRQYASIKPYLQPVIKLQDSQQELLQTESEREKLDGLYECIMCACCSAACPSYWWNQEKFLGPAILLQAARFIYDSRDAETANRLKQLDDAYSLLRCRTVLNCASVCPKQLNPAKAIGNIRRTMLLDTLKSLKERILNNKADK